VPRAARFQLFRFARMPTRTITIYEVPNTYVANGGNVQISAIRTLVINDDDLNLDGTAALDPGAPQTFTVDGQPVTSYNFIYDDNVTIGGTPETVKTFQMVIGGVTRSFIMNDTGSSIPGAVVGSTVQLVSFGNYTSVPYTNFPCFAAGTMIETARGPIAVEHLVQGDMVRTVDNGFQPLRWVGVSEVGQRMLLAHPHLAPIRILAGALGPDRPARDLRLSPQHRVVVSGPEVDLHFGHAEVLVPALALLGRAGVAQEDAAEGVTYLHLLFDRHEVILAEGLAVESLLCGTRLHHLLDPAQVAEISKLFPGAPLIEHEVPARPLLRRGEARCLTTRAA